MNFSDILTATRKAKNLSQEQLAEQVGVSRQAISKWELGDTTPDLPKLLALSEALGISLDALCGRIPAEETPAAESVPASPAPASPKSRRGWYLLLGALAGIVLAVAGIFLLNIPRGDHQSDEPVPAIPADFTVAGVNFACDGESGVLSFRFAPSMHYPEDFSYTMVFASTGEGAHHYEAVYEGGVCLGTAEDLPRGYAYGVSVTVSNGREALSVPVAENLGFAPGQASWTPLV